MKTVYLTGPTPGTPFNDGLYTRAETQLQKAGYIVINPAKAEHLKTRRQQVAAVATRADLICALDIHDGRHIIRVANELDIPVRTLNQIAGAKP